MGTKDKYFVLELGHGMARVASMTVYWAWRENHIRQGFHPDTFSSPTCHCLDVTKEEATVFLKMMGLTDVTYKWELSHSKA